MVKTVASIIGMIPEGLMLLTSVSLAAGVVTLGQKKTLVNELYGIESLARVDVICVDKTGTLTSGKMTLEQTIPAPDVSKERLQDILASFLCGMGADGSTAAALTEACPPRPVFPCLETVPFSSQRKWSLAVLEGVGSVILGAPERLLSGAELKKAQELAAQGLRVLALMESPEPPSVQADDVQLPAQRKLLALLCLCDGLRPQVRQTVEYFGREGVQIKVISGDNPVAVSRIAADAGIENAERWLDASAVHSDEQLVQAAESYTVFGRVTPQQKQLLVRALQDAGHTVAMTGDGVNDILAMKDADCSVAMASGSEAAAQSAQVVLLESDFARMPEVVLEGRRVVNNIQRSASLFLVKNIFSLMMALFSVIFMLTYPLEPSQISLISAFTIGIPGFLLALEPNKERIQGNFLRNVLLKALPAGLTDVLAVGALVVCGEVFSLPQEDIATAATMLLAVVGFMILVQISRPLNAMKYAILIGDALGLILCGIFLNQLFALNAMSEICVLLLIVFAFASESLFRNLSLLVRSIQSWLEKKREKRRS